MPGEEKVISGRGSEQLLKSLWGRSGGFSEKGLTELINATRLKGVELVHWWIRGQPQPDILEGALFVKPGTIGSLIDSLIKLNRVRVKLDVFPLGTPAVDRIMVKFQNVSEMRDPG